MPEFARMAAQRDPASVAIRDPNRSYTWAEVDDILNRTANLLLDSDLGPERRVVVFAENAAETAFAHLGDGRAGRAVALGPHGPCAHEHHVGQAAHHAQEPTVGLAAQRPRSSVDGGGPVDRGDHVHEDPRSSRGGGTVDIVVGRDRVDVVHVGAGEHLLHVPTVPVVRPPGAGGGLWTAVEKSEFVHRHFHNSCPSRPQDDLPRVVERMGAMVPGSGHAPPVVLGDPGQVVERKTVGRR